MLNPRRYWIGIDYVLLIVIVTIKTFLPPNIEKGRRRGVSLHLLQRVANSGDTPQGFALERHIVNPLLPLCFIVVLCHHQPTATKYPPVCDPEKRCDVFVLKDLIVDYSHQISGGESLSPLSDTSGQRSEVRANVVEIKHKYHKMQILLKFLDAYVGPLYQNDFGSSVLSSLGV